MNKLLVDVVVTTKNNPVGMAQLLTALFYQDYPNIRLVINDESNVFILQSFQISRILDLLSIKNIHMEYNRNLNSKGTPYAEYLAFKMVKAPYAWVVDDDTIPEPDALSKLMEKMVENPSIGFMQGCFSDITNSRDHQNFENKPISDVKPGDPVFYFLYYTNDFTTSIPFGEGGNLLYNVTALKDPDVPFSYFNESFINSYGNNSGIHIIVSLAVRLKYQGYLRTGSKVYYLERDSPRFTFKSMRNTIMKRYVNNMISMSSDNKILNEFDKYLGLNDY